MARRPVRPRTRVATISLLATTMVSLVWVAVGSAKGQVGFRIDVADTGFGAFELTDFVHVDETHVLATGKSGGIRWVALDDPEMGRQVAALDVHDDTDLGLVSIALANDYVATGRLYLASNHRDAEGAFGRLSAWTVDDPADPHELDGPEVILDHIRTDDAIHSVGEIVVRSDDTIYLAVGDGRPNRGPPSLETLRTFDPGAPQGKVLRVHRDGRGVADNPWYSADEPTAWRSRAWVVGLRNPFRFTTLPGSEDVLVIGNVGRAGDESLFVGGPGSNFGWPCREGRRRTRGYRDLAGCQELEAQDRSPFTPPVWAYDRTLPPRGSVSIIGGAFATSPAYPAEFRGAYLFGDYVRQVVWSARLDAAGNMARPPEAGPDGTGSTVFARDVGAPVSFVTSPSGLVSWADTRTGQILRLQWGRGEDLPLRPGVSAVDSGGSA